MRYTLSNTIDIGKRVNVYLNDKLVEAAVMADTRQGKVRRIVTPIRVHKYGKRLLMETLHGNVRVELAPWH